MRASVADAEHEVPLLAVTDLVVDYRTRGWRERPFRALHGVDLEVAAGRTTGVVGESGSGKTTLGRAILGLVEVTSGSVTFRGDDLPELRRLNRRTISQQVQVVFQDPYGSLNPSMSVEEILSEPLSVHGVSGSDARARVLQLLEQVGMPRRSADRRPREFSGGQRQRIAIARALALRPSLIVCDEPVSALDLSTQARVLDLLLNIQGETGVSYVLISHDLDVVRHVSHDVTVMHEGEVVEHGDAATITSEPSEPYTKQLLLSSPVPDVVVQRQRRKARANVGLRSVEEDDDSAV